MTRRENRTLKVMLADLAARGINELHVEAGSKLHGLRIVARCQSSQATA
jgi:riboflavin biosynthesis pyrimidine reductase